MKTFEKFVHDAISVDPSKKEPFCPFPTCGYCNVAYSKDCYKCEFAHEAYNYVYRTIDFRKDDKY